MPRKPHATDRAYEARRALNTYNGPIGIFRGR